MIAAAFARARPPPGRRAPCPGRRRHAPASAARVASSGSLSTVSSDAANAPECRRGSAAPPAIRWPTRSMAAITSARTSSLMRTCVAPASCCDGKTCLYVAADKTRADPLAGGRLDMVEARRHAQADVEALAVDAAHLPGPAIAFRCPVGAGKAGHAAKRHRRSQPELPRRLARQQAHKSRPAPQVQGDRARITAAFGAGGAGGERASGAASCLPPPLAPAFAGPGAPASPAAASAAPAVGVEVAPAGDVAQMLLVALGEGVAAAAVGNEIEVAGARRIGDRLERGAAGIGDRSRRQAPG